MHSLRPVTLDEIRAASKRLRTLAIRTPLLRLNVDNAPAEIYLKMENLQPIGSFKIRPAGSAILNIPEEHMAHGVHGIVGLPKTGCKQAS